MRKAVVPPGVTKDIQRIELTDNLEIALPDGTVMRLRPGPYGKGLSLVPVPQVAPRTARSGAAPRAPGTGKRGRKPRPSTIKLREKLLKDSRGGGVREPREYVKWLIQQDDEVSLATARQVVYRERRAALDGTLEV